MESEENRRATGSVLARLANEVVSRSNASTLDLLNGHHGLMYLQAHLRCLSNLFDRFVVR